MPTGGIQVALTLAWVGSPDDDLWPRHPDQPPIEAVVQLFYGLNLLYVEALDLERDRIRTAGRSRVRSWYRTYPQWRRFLRRHPLATPMHRSRPPAREWPSYVPTPEAPAGTGLRVDSLVMASPLELVLVVPATAALSLAALRFVHAIERAWNTKKRIRLEGLELDRKIYEEQVARELARERYDQLRLSGFSLESGFIRFPEDWDWPKNC